MLQIYYNNTIIILILSCIYYSYHQARKLNHIMSISWYMSLYYKYRDYPINHINNKYKRNELKNIYSNIFARLSLYFYIDVQHDHLFGLAAKHKCMDTMKSNMNIRSAQRFYSSNLTCTNSKIPQRNQSRLSTKKLKSQVIHNQNTLYPQNQLTEKSLASMNIFAKQDKPLDQEEQLAKIKLTNLLKLVINTSREVICGILMQMGQEDRDEGYDGADDSSLQASKIYRDDTEQTTQAVMLSNGISLEVIPNNNEEINYYFLDFCSKMQIAQFQSFQIFNHNIKKNTKYQNGDNKTANFNKKQDNVSCNNSYSQRLQDHSESINNTAVLSNKKKSITNLNQMLPQKSSFNSISEQKLNNGNRSNQKLISDVIDKKQQGVQIDMDKPILQLLQNQIQFSHNLLKKFQGIYSNTSCTNPNLSKAQSNTSLNIIIQTWLQIIAMLQSQDVIYQIVRELVRDESTSNLYIQKINSYLYFISLASTKLTLAKSVSKQNFLYFVPELLEGTRSLNDFKLQKSDGIIQIYDVLLDRYSYSTEAYGKMFERWRHIGFIISQVLIQSPDIFWARVFQSCCKLFDQYLQEKVQFCYSLILLYERLENQQMSLIRLPDWKKKYYRKCIRVIIERQVGCILGNLNSETNKTNIRSKISMVTNKQVGNQNQKSYKSCSQQNSDNKYSNNMKIQQSNYIYYDQKTAGNQQKISELRQWEKIVREGIESLRGYRKVLDLGLTMFNGILECVIAFFLQTYFNFKKIACISDFSFLNVVDKYCSKLANSTCYQSCLLNNIANTSKIIVNNSNVYKNNNIQQNVIKNSHKVFTNTLAIKSYKQTQPQLIQLQIHKQRYKTIIKRLSYSYRSCHSNQCQNMQSTPPGSVNPSPLPSSSNLHNQDQQNYSQYQAQASNINFFPDSVLVLQEETISSVIAKLRQVYDNADIDVDHQKKIVQMLNTHIRLVNQCNFIIGVMLLTQYGLGNPDDGIKLNSALNSKDKSIDKQGKQFQEKPMLRPLSPHMTVQKPPQMILTILDTSQLRNCLQKLANVHEERIHTNIAMIQTQNYRAMSGPSNHISKYRMSSINVPFAKNNNLTNGAPYASPFCSAENGSSFDRIQFNYDRIWESMKEHNACLQLIVGLYYKYSKYYRLYTNNIFCDVCCSNGCDPCDNNDHINSKYVQNNKQSQQKLSARHHILTSIKVTQYLRKYQTIHRRSSKISKTISKTKGPQTVDLQLQLCQAIQLNNINYQILLIFMFIASLQVDSSTFLAIYKQDLTSNDKLEKVRVIGKAYYEVMHGLVRRDHGDQCKSVLEESLIENRKDLYVENFLIVLISLIELIYDRDQDCDDLAPYVSLLMNYFISITYKASNSHSLKINQQLINLTKIISQSLDWNQQNLPDISEKDFILKLLQLRTTLQNQNKQRVKKIRELINQEFKILKRYTCCKNKVEYLQKKLMYLMMRQIYFDSYYDIGVFQVKSVQARKNFAMYQTKMLNFFQQIIAKDQQQFIQRKLQQLKQRSAHLKGYLLDYQKQPLCSNPEQRKVLMKIVCIFDKTLNLLTQNKQFEMKKRGSNSLSIQRKNRNKNQPIYMHYVSTQFIKPNKNRVKVFENQSYYFFRAIQIYQSMLCKKVQDSSKKYSIYKQLGFSVPTSIYSSFGQKDLEIIKKSKQSLLALWINYEYKNLHEKKMLLSRQNFLSKIQKLYIDLDVRHKVFQSFKDKILNYQMQKTKIYHQYMDYIRGLKLDVYSHVTGEDPFPYFKLINAIKLYRLNIKQKQLEEKVNQEFGKNLGKWNQGISRDVKDYNQWVSNQMIFWKTMNEGSNKTIKELFQIYGIVNKQLQRQQIKTIQYQYVNKQNSNAVQPHKSAKMIQTSSSILTKKSLHKQKSLINKQK